MQLRLQRTRPVLQSVNTAHSSSSMKHLAETSLPSVKPFLKPAEARSLTPQWLPSDTLQPLKFSRAGFFRHIEKDFFGFFRFFRRKLPDLTEDEFRGMLRVVNPLHENYYINARNAAAHRVTPEQARESAADDDQPHLLKWVDLLAACKKDQHACTGDVAFKHACPSSSQIVERYELHSMLVALKCAPDEVRLECTELLDDLKDFRVNQQKLDQDRE